MAGKKGKSGGKREGSGRKTLAEEMELPKLLESTIGETGKETLIKKVYNEAIKGSFQDRQMLMHYLFGKPTDKVDMTSGGEKLPASEIKHVIEFKDYSKK